MITAGGGYTATNTYDIEESNGDGVGGQIKIDTVTDLGTSIGKLQAVANESAPPLSIDGGFLTTKGISARISGTGAKGHLIYE